MSLFPCFSSERTPTVNCLENKSRNQPTPASSGRSEDGLVPPHHRHRLRLRGLRLHAPRGRRPPWSAWASRRPWRRPAAGATCPRAERSRAVPRAPTGGRWRISDENGMEVWMLTSQSQILSLHSEGVGCELTKSLQGNRDVRSLKPHNDLVHRDDAPLPEKMQQDVSPRHLVCWFLIQKLPVTTPDNPQRS